MRPQTPQRLGVESLGGGARLLRGLGQEARGQGGHVGLGLAQVWQLQAHHGQTVQQVGAEAAAADLGLEALAARVEVAANGSCQFLAFASQCYFPSRRARLPNHTRGLIAPGFTFPKRTEEVIDPSRTLDQVLKAYEYGFESA